MWSRANEREAGRKLSQRGGQGPGDEGLGLQGGDVMFYAPGDESQPQAG